MKKKTKSQSEEFIIHVSPCYHQHHNDRSSWSEDERKLFANFFNDFLYSFFLSRSYFTHTFVGAYKMCSKVRIKCNPALCHSGSVSIIIPIFEKPTESMRSLSTVPVRRRLVGAEKVGVETLNWIVDNIFHFSLLQFNLQLVCVPLILVLLLDRRERLHYNTSRVLLLILLQLLLQLFQLWLHLLHTGRRMK